MQGEKRPRSLGRRMGRVLVSAALAVGLAGAPSAAPAAFAEERASAPSSTMGEGQADRLLSAPQAGFAAAGEDVFDWATDAPSANVRSTDVLPAAFDLRDEGVVTPVKFQNPWNSCWSFGVASASEASIVSEAARQGIDVPDEFTDVSERHLAWFAYTPLPADDDSGQGGEGMVSVEGGNARLDSGGLTVHGTSLFSSGIGPVPESEVPYRGKEGTIVTGTDAQGNPYDFYYSRDDDWSVDEALRFQQMIEFEESAQLPSPGDYSVTEDYEGAERANDAIKQQLLEGRAVAITFYADQSRPNRITETGYMNPGNNESKTWAHYTPDELPISHAVTIVGWDDAYSKENFGNPDPVTGEVDPSKQPPMDGAWIVKNSWGSDDGFPNGYPGGWGNDDDGDGGGDGYFYLSYWDKTITKPETFDFAVESVQSEDERYFVHQYDYMPSPSVAALSSSSRISMANVFTASGAETIRRLACETTRPNTQTTFEVYLLDEGATLPDEGVKLAEVEETFEWGGFHTVELTDEQSFTLDEGERFSVVVTQKCLDDGSYHASYDSGWSEASLEVLEQQYREQYYDERYQTYLKAATDALWVQARDEAFQAGKTEAEAIDAANAYVETEEARASAAETAASKAEAAIRDMVPTFYCEGVVNEGESFIYELDEEGEFFAWTDFYETSKAQEAQGVEVDNLPIKAYGYEVEEGDEYASAEALKQLEDAVKDARNDLAQTVVSADGTDVAKGAPWVTRAVHDAFEAAIAAAEAAVGAERPLAGDIERAAADLAAAREAFDAAKADGLKGGGGSGSDTRKDPDTDAGAKGDGALARTGDDAPLGTVAAVGAVGGLSVLAVAVRRCRAGEK